MRSVFGICLLLWISCSFYTQSNSYSFRIRNGTGDTLRVVYEIQSITDSLGVVNPNSSFYFPGYSSRPAEQHALTEDEFSQYIRRVSIYKGDSVMHEEIPGNMVNWVRDYDYDMGNHSYSYFLAID